MEEKYKIALDESYRDPTNILRKLKWHEAAEREMESNQVRFEDLVKVWDNIYSYYNFVTEAVLCTQTCHWLSGCFINIMNKQSGKILDFN